MGTFVQIKAYSSHHSRPDLKKITDKAFEKASLLEAKFDIFDPGSEISLVNVSGGKRVSKELIDVLEKASRIGEVTDGSFDVTVSPVLKENGFYGDMPGELLSRIPDSKNGIGRENVMIDVETGTVLLKNNAWIDLSGIAKGYIVDSMAGILLEEGVERFLVDAGGDMYCHSSGGNDAWVIGVRDPKRKNVALRINIGSQAVATSGDYENIVQEADDKVLAHIVKPDTESVIDREFYSVTVISSTCAEADALATGMVAMGTDKAVELADRLNGTEIIILEEKDGVRNMELSADAGMFIEG